MIKPLSTKTPNWNYITCHHTHLQLTHRCCHTTNNALAACGSYHCREAKHKLVAKCKAPCSSRREAHSIICTYATAPGVIVSNIAGLSLSRQICWSFLASLLVPAHIRPKGQQMSIVQSTLLRKLTTRLSKAQACHRPWLMPEQTDLHKVGRYYASQSVETGHMVSAEVTHMSGVP